MKGKFLGIRQKSVISDRGKTNYLSPVISTSIILIDNLHDIEQEGGVEWFP